MEFRNAAGIRLPWLEERVEAVRLALGVRGFPADDDWRRLHSLSRPCPGVQRALHETVSEEQAWLRQVVETAHQDPLDRTARAIIAHGIASTRLRILFSDPRTARSGDGVPPASGRKLAEAFVSAWALPSRLVQLIPDDAELMWQSNCDRDVIEDRRGDLNGASLDLKGVPTWAAEQRYHLVVHMASHRPGIVVYSRRRPGATVAGAAVQPEFALACARHTVEACAARVAADLLTLTPAEFEYSYAHSRPVRRPAARGDRVAMPIRR